MLKDDYENLLWNINGRPVEYDMFRPESWKLLKDEFKIDVKKELEFKFKEFVTERPAFGFDKQGFFLPEIQRSFLDVYQENLHNRIIKGYIAKYTSRKDPTSFFWEIYGKELDYVKSKIKLTYNPKFATLILITWRNNIPIVATNEDIYEEIMRYKQSEFGDEIRDEIMEEKVRKVKV